MFFPFAETPFQNYTGIFPHSPCKKAPLKSLGISLQDCARACSNTTRDCQAFSYSLKPSVNKHCKLWADRCVSSVVDETKAFWLKNEDIMLDLSSHGLHSSWPICRTCCSVQYCYVKFSTSKIQNAVQCVMLESHWHMHPICVLFAC